MEQNAKNNADVEQQLVKQDETTALLKELLEDSHKERLHERRDRLYSIIKVVCLGIIALTVVVVGIIVVPRVNTALDALDTALVQVNDAATEVTAISKQLNEANVGAVVADADELITQTGATLDAAMEKVDTALLEMQQALDKVSSFDIEKLNSGIESFTAIVGPLSKLFGKN